MGEVLYCVAGNLLSKNPGHPLLYASQICAPARRSYGSGLHVVYTTCTKKGLKTFGHNLLQIEVMDFWKISTSDDKLL